MHEMPLPVTRARGIDERGNSRVLCTRMRVADLADVLLDGGWKYALIEDDDVPAALVTLDAGARKRVRCRTREAP
jgi:hypothetical protein